MLTVSLKLADTETTARHLPYSALIAALDEGFRNGCAVPTRHHHTIERQGEPDATLLIMPAWSEGDDAEQFLGVKLVTVVPGNTVRNLPGLTSTYMLYDRKTGQQLALLDGNVITARRTVATSALAAKYLAREDATKLLVLGAGRVASLIPDAYRAVRAIDQIAVWDINPSTAARLVDALKSRGMKATVVTNLKDAVQAADIISSATLATTPLVKGEWLQPGVHLDLIGGFTPKMREADDRAVQISSVYVDTPEALHEAGDLVQPIESGIISESHVLATLNQLCQKTRPGRISPDQITYFKAVGSGLADLVAAKMVHQRL